MNNTSGSDGTTGSSNRGSGSTGYWAHRAAEIDARTRRFQILLDDTPDQESIAAFHQALGIPGSEVTAGTIEALSQDLRSPMDQCTKDSITCTRKDIAQRVAEQYEGSAAAFAEKLALAMLDEGVVQTPGWASSRGQTSQGSSFNSG